MIHHASRCAHDNLHSPQAYNLFSDFLSPVNGKHFDSVHIFRNFAQLLRRLNGKLSGGTQYNGLQLSELRVYLLQSGNAKGSRLSRTGLSLSDNVLPL